MMKKMLPFILLTLFGFSQAQIIAKEVKENSSIELENLNTNTVDFSFEKINTICLADAGTIAIDAEATGNPNSTTSIAADNLSAVICVDNLSDPIVVSHNNPGATSLSYRYVITNEDASEILNITNSRSIDLNGAGTGTCQIWGWSYTGLADNGASFIGGPLSELRAVDACSDVSIMSITVTREAADAGTIAIDLNATRNLNNSTTSFTNDGLSAVICIDNTPNPIIVSHNNPGATNLSYRYVITNEDASEILNITNSRSIDLNGAGTGTCQIWGWSYRGLADNGASFIGGPLSELRALETCSDVSTMSITVIREAADAGTIAIDAEATGNPNNTTSIAADNLSAVICVDNLSDPIVVSHNNPGATNLSYRYVITNEDASEILNITNSRSIDLNGAGTGTCQIWGWSYRGLADNGASFIGGPLSELRALETCSDVSTMSITVIREAADAGTIAIDIDATGNPNNTTSIAADGLSAVICVDNVSDPLIVSHNNPGATNLSYRYVITNEDASEILNITNSRSIDLNGAGTGTCQIWGWSYRGLADNGASFIGGPLSELRRVETCSDVSAMSITVTREAADAGTIAIDLNATRNLNNSTTSFTNDGLSAVICIDNTPNPIIVSHNNPGATNLSYRYVITNEDASEILNITNSRSIDLNGAGTGTCQIWGWSYRGLADNGASFIGGPLSELRALETCSDVSTMSITVIREAADAGTIAIDIDATGNPNNTTSIAADNLSAVICVDNLSDPIVVSHNNPGATNLSYRYVITNEDASEILNITNSRSIDLNGAGTGTCQIWGWSYRGLADNGASFIGGPLSELRALETCSDVSTMSITVTREAADAGTIAIDIDATGNPNNTTSIAADGLSAVICVDNVSDPLIVSHNNPGATNLSYRYVITNEDASEILNITNSRSIDLNGAGTGTCQIWGWSYRGLADNGASFIGGPLSELRRVETCSDVSTMSITVTREAADAGTIAIDLNATRNLNISTTSVENNGLAATIITEDGIANPIIVSHNNPGATNLSYRYVITNEDASEILNITNSTSIDLDSAGVGICQIWGWSYRGLADNGASFIGGPLSELRALETCSDVSTMSIAVTREANTILSTSNFSSKNINEVEFSFYPNPAIDFINIENTFNDSINVNIQLFDLSGNQLYQSNSLQQINVSAFPAGIYVLRFTNLDNGLSVIKKITKQ